ncbi:hypothetical protein COOONC_11940 [Cooperia oncophora]
MCVKPMYGSDTKFLLFAEYIEHYKLQGVQHFYIYVKDVDQYTNKVCSTSHSKLIIQLTNNQEEVITGMGSKTVSCCNTVLCSSHWIDCIHRSRHHSNYTIYADLDERILPTDTNTTLSAYTTLVELPIMMIIPSNKVSPIETTSTSRKGKNRKGSPLSPVGDVI